MNTPGTVLIVGASGLVGTAAAIEFADAGWQVITASRRAPQLLDGRAHRHIQLDLTDADRCGAAVRVLADVTHVVYTAVLEAPGLVGGWSDPQQIAVNGAMLRNLMEPLAQVASLQHVTILQGTKAYGGRVQPMRIPARERQPRVEHPNFYWLHEDYIADKSARAGFAFTIFRPQLIVGPNWGVVMNLPPIIGIFAALCRAEGRPFAFPGGAQWVWEAADVRLVAAAIRWAAHADAARGETFNLTNGEVFAFRDLWPAMAATLGVQTGPDTPLRLAEYLPARADLWRTLVKRHGLQPLTMDALLGESHHYADMCFAYGATSPPPATYVSSVKIRQAGFTAAYDTEHSFCHWLTDLMRRGVLPPA